MQAEQQDAERLAERQQGPARLSQTVEREPQDHTRAGALVAQPERQQPARSHVRRSREVGLPVSLVRAAHHARESPGAQGRRQR